MNFSLAFKYLNYILFSRHGRGHGIHSPFVFNLVSVVFRNNAGPGISIKVEQIRKRLIYDPGEFWSIDLGSRSGSVKTDVRKVSDIARIIVCPTEIRKIAGKYGC